MAHIRGVQHFYHWTTPGISPLDNLKQLLGSDLSSKGNAERTFSPANFLYLC
jgi:hypothetical protein